ncbi:MAG: hypothetical protein BWY91_01298 [bacterium ADurb.BinA028]|nr:MAG: hypothetical protein BWY91_01298 [bacterium ADurb.BinA028]
MTDDAQRTGPVVPAPGDRGRGEAAGLESLVGVDVWCVEVGQLTQGGLDTGEEVVEDVAVPTLAPIVGEDGAAVGAAQRQVDVAGVALAFVVLRHEGQRLPVLRGDLLGGVLVDDVVVAGAQDILVTEGDLMLAEVALPLGRLDLEARGIHLVADLAQQRFDDGAALDGVVDVIAVDPREADVARVPRGGIRLLEDDELQLGAGEGGETQRRGSIHLRAQHRARRLAHQPPAVEPGEVALDRRRIVLPRGPSQRREVEVEHHVAVAGLPRADGIAINGVHLDVDGQQVVAALGAVAQDGVDEPLTVDPLALQSALHVGEGDHDGVDGPVGDLGTQLVEGELGSGHRRSFGEGGRVMGGDATGHGAAATWRRSVPP